jgi:putative oxidoreductase
MSKHLFKPDAASLILRLGLGAIFVFHGFLKIAYGSNSWTTDINPSLQMVVAWSEAIVGVAFLAGILTRIAALVSIVIMIGAIAFVTGSLGLTSMDPAPRYNGLNLVTTGYEYNVAIIAMSAALIMLGGGVVSLDHILFGRKKAKAGSSEPAPAPQAPASPPQVHSGV